LSCNGSGLAWTSSSAGKKLDGFEAFMDAALMDESGVALNGEADITSKTSSRIPGWTRRVTNKRETRVVSSFIRQKILLPASALVKKTNFRRMCSFDQWLSRDRVRYCGAAKIASHRGMQFHAGSSVIPALGGISETAASAIGSTEAGFISFQASWYCLYGSASNLEIQPYRELRPGQISMDLPQSVGNA
jgi:hypothetical protein